MKRPFLASWPKPGAWRVAGGLYWPTAPVKPIRLRVYRCGHMELK